jgi:hypothetical protein
MMYQLRYQVLAWLPAPHSRQVEHVVTDLLVGGLDLGLLCGEIHVEYRLQAGRPAGEQRGVAGSADQLGDRHRGQRPGQGGHGIAPAGRADLLPQPGQVFTQPRAQPLDLAGGERGAHQAALPGMSLTGLCHQAADRAVVDDPVAQALQLK